MTVSAWACMYAALCHLSDYFVSRAERELVREAQNLSEDDRDSQQHSLVRLVSA